MVKSPNIANYIDELAEHDDIALDLVVVPLRDIDEAVDSRVRVFKDNLAKKGWLARFFGSKRGFAGGMVRTSDPKKQQLVLLRSLSHLLVQCAKHNLPLAIVHYPRRMDDPAYLFQQLHPILGNIDEQTFHKALNTTLRPDWVTRK